MGVFQLGDGGLDGGLFVGGNLVAELAELLLGLEDDGVGVVELVDTLFLLGVAGGISLGFLFHALDFGVGET